jgi:hypothetical protein
MNAYKVDAIVTEEGLAILEGLPLAIGSPVEVIILDSRVSGRSGDLLRSVSQQDYLVGISSLMTEWESAADESAYQNL